MDRIIPAPEIPKNMLKIFILKSVLAAGIMLGTTFGPTSPVRAQGKTIYMENPTEFPPATLADISWICGFWKGEALGGETEEFWSPPSAGHMMGVFRLIRNGELSFCEILSLSEENHTLVLRVKHFDKTLKGWEEKEESMVFELLKKEPGKLFFNGLTFEKISENEINVWVNEADDKKEAREVKFLYLKVQ
jgi:hypothetical protein